MFQTIAAPKGSDRSAYLNAAKSSPNDGQFHKTMAKYHHVMSEKHHDTLNDDSKWSQNPKTYRYRFKEGKPAATRHEDLEGAHSGAFLDHHDLASMFPSSKKPSSTAGVRAAYAKNARKSKSDYDFHKSMRAYHQAEADKHHKILKQLPSKGGQEFNRNEKAEFYHANAASMHNNMMHTIGRSKKATN